MAMAIAAALLVTGCRIVPTPPKGGGQAMPAAGAFDPDRMAADLWQPKVLPYLAAKAGPLRQVLDLAQRDPDAAGARWGYRPRPDAPWVYVVRLDGRIVGADLDTRAATITVDADSAPEVDVQIGPVIRGTALRDALDFVSFDAFTNQIDFARFGKALNQVADRTQLAALPRDGLAGRHVRAVGALTLGGARPLLTPATLALEP